MLIAARQKNVIQARAEMLKRDLDSLSFAVKYYEIAIDSLRSLDAFKTQSFTRELSVMASKEGDYQTRAKQLEKDLRRQVRKTKLTAFAGIGLAGAIAFLFLR